MAGRDADGGQRFVVALLAATAAATGWPSSACACPIRVATADQLAAEPSPTTVPVPST